MLSASERQIDSSSPAGGMRLMSTCAVSFPVWAGGSEVGSAINLNYFPKAKSAETVKSHQGAPKRTPTHVFKTQAAL
jgi:hypothetical protein